MSRVDNQRRLFLELIEELRPWWRKDPGLPRRLTAWLARHRAGSRDRRLYRELAYTAWRILPWIEDASPETVVRHVANHAEVNRATAAFIDQFSTPDQTVPPPPESLLPTWLETQCPAALEPCQRDALLRRAPLWIRLQTTQEAKVAAEFAQLKIPIEPSPLISSAWRLPTATPIADNRAYRDGLFEVQDIGSQALLTCLPSPAQGQWLDACAGAGGKTLQLAEQLRPNGGTVTAHDIRPAALQELGIRQKRAGFTNITLTPNPTGKFDGVLVDAPCTGSGTWRRSPHLKWTTQPADIIRSSERQSLILGRFSTHVKVGGLLVYATCSLCRTENEDVVAAFRQSHPAFRPVPLRHPVTKTLVKEGQICLLPADLDSDAYFVAVLQRT